MVINSKFDDLEITAVLIEGNFGCIVERYIASNKMKSSMINENQIVTYKDDEKRISIDFHLGQPEVAFRDKVVCVVVQTDRVFLRPLLTYFSFIVGAIFKLEVSKELNHIDTTHHRQCLIVAKIDTASI